MLKIIKLKVFGVQYVLKLYGGSNPATERVIFRRQGEEVACIHCIHATTEFSTLWQVGQGGLQRISMDSRTFLAELAKLMAAWCRFFSEIKSTARE